MPSVLFVCTANQFRSPLAAACFINSLNQANAIEGWKVESAGTWTITGLPASSLAIQIANRLGLPGLNAHKTRPVDQKLLDQFDLILVMELGHLEAVASEFPSVRGRLNLLSNVVNGIPYSIPDPAGQDGNPEEVASELQMMIQSGSRQIMELAQSLHKTRQSSNQGNS